MKPMNSPDFFEFYRPVAPALLLELRAPGVDSGPGLSLG